jgi:hypothetical protein
MTSLPSTLLVSRDLFEHTLLAAYLHEGRQAEAGAMLRRRVDRQPSVPVTRP